MRLRTFATGLSKNFTVPWEAWTSPREAFNVVDLPEPLGPTIQVIWPVGACRLKPSMALTPRYDTCNFSIRSTSVVMIGSFATLVAWTASDGFGTSILCSNAVFANYLVGDYVKRRCKQTLCSSQRTFKYGRPYA